MNPIKNVDILIQQTSNFAEGLGEESDFRKEVSQLHESLHMPCVLAVAGRVKSGKSSFINALMDTDLAMVGESETTATINIFRYGTPNNPDRPVTVIWENGMRADVSMDFMKSLQGHDEETLAKASKIAYLEIKIKNELLRNITLVDTPGTDAVVGKDGDEHQQITERYFGLRQKHRRQTDDFVNRADAVIYLVGAVGTSSNRRFLEDFEDNTTNLSALTAIGILSKVDVDEELLKRRDEQAAYVAQSMKEHFYTVVPVSAGLHVMLNTFDLAQFQSWQTIWRTVPQKAFNYLMRQESMYMTEREDIIAALWKDSDEVPLTLEQRRSLRADMPWSLFRTIANALYSHTTIEEAMEELNAIANIHQVRKVVTEQFVHRSQLIRCYRILKELKEKVMQMRRKYDSDQHVKDEIVKGLIIPIEQLQLNVEDYDQRYRFLRALQEDKEKWEQDEYEELTRLLGLYGDEDRAGLTLSDERRVYWQIKSRRYIDKRMREIAQYISENF